MKWTRLENPLQKLQQNWKNQPTFIQAMLLAALIFTGAGLVYAVSSSTSGGDAPTAWNEEGTSAQAKRQMAMAMRDMASSAEADEVAADEADGELVETTDGAPEPNIAPAPAGAAANGVPPTSMPKKIIQNFELNIRVKDIDEAGKRLTEMVTTAGGYISHSERSGGSGAPRSGSWVCRIPDSKSGSVAKELAALGDIIQQTMSANDVSEEFYDVEARLKNKKIEEERLVKHLKDSTGKLADILAVERELSRVRSEVEQIQGRLNYLSNQTSLATIRVSMEEFVGQRPQTPVGFGSRIVMTFIESLGGIKDTATGIVLGLVAMIPWLAIFAVLSGLIYALLRKKKNQ